MPVQLNGATSGSVTLTVPATAGTNTLTVPAKTGNIITSADSGTVTQTMLGTNVAGNGPAFSAYQNASQTIANVTWTKIQCSTEEFDIASCYDNVTNYRFTPNVAGYYQVNINCSMNTGAGTQLSTIYKNGAEFKRGQRISNGAGALGTSGSALIYFNGTTDYVEMYVYQDSGSSTTLNAGNVALNYFQASLVRSA